jgi:formate hydrogenlyase subunit 3/multisubunit Na+/H+ antiporter MnhD subunit
MDVSWAGLRDPAILVFIAIILIAVSGLPGLVLASRTGLGQRIATSFTLVGSLLGLAGSLALLLSGHTVTYTIAWTLPFDSCDIAIDPLSALFLLPVFLISGSASIYAGGYRPAAANQRTEPMLTFFLGLLVAAMAVVVTARNGILFLMAWEIMALAAYFGLTVEHQSREVREAGIVYLVATHIGTLFLFVMFALLRAATGSFLLPAGGSLEAATLTATAIFLSAVIGFGFKAGLMPLHIWLPAAHANAPSHVSALMSGVMLKMGLYGIIRVISFFYGEPLWWGISLLVAGAVSALLGITFAIAQRDLKRLLAYSSIENIGIITVGLGTALIGVSTHRPLLGLLGLAGAFFHILNHSMFKPLLFLGAGALIHATGSRLADLMGGLSRRMPWTASFFLVGAAAISGLPPLNGFAGEFLLYTAFFRDAVTAPVPYLSLAAPLLALVGGLAALCFVNLYGMVFLGHTRSAAAGHSHEAGWLMLAPMGGLALLCAVFGIFPQIPFALVMPAVMTVTPALATADSSLFSTALLLWITAAALALFLLGGALAFLLRRRIRRAPVGSESTWGCGYLRPAATMQYSASSFGEMTTRLFAMVIRPRFSMPVLAGYFAGNAEFRSDCPETLLEQLILPLFRGADWLFSFFRRIQHGEQQLYVLYIFIALFLLMIWAH